ncbi:MAG: iron-sulfur cluster assembly protein [Pseudomonadota bacterium]
MTAAASIPVWDLKPRIVEALRTINDPEIPVNIHDLGLVYAIEIYDGGRVRILMTLTTPGCPVAQEFPVQVAQVVKGVPGVSDCEVEIVWEPPWSAERITVEDRLRLGLL